MSIGDCPHWPQCGHRAMNQCDCTGPGDTRVPGTSDQEILGGEQTTEEKGIVEEKEQSPPSV